MQFGVGLPNYSKGASVQGVREVARAAEELGYDSVWTTDHLLVPQEHAPVFGYVIEALTALAYIAGMTRRVKLGTSVLVLPQRNAIEVAKEIASLDQLSDGRVILGVAAGWMEGEFKYHGMDFHQRGKLLDEGLAVLRAIWEMPAPAFHGQFYDFEGAVSDPKPIQKQIPIWVGGSSDAAIARAARYEGYHPNAHNPDVLAQKIAQLRAMSQGRAITVSPRFSIDLDPTQPPIFTTAAGETRRRLTGTLDDIRNTLRDYQKVGVDYPALFFPQTDLNLMLKQMETFAKEVMPEF